MRQNGNIGLQDPAASPTFALSRPVNTDNPDVPPSLRRNLFGSHLSRRPAGPLPVASTDRMPDPFHPVTSTSSHPHPEIYQSSIQHSQRAANVNHQNAYDPPPRVSPTRSQSPAKSLAYANSNTSIVALDPTTGRPQIPVMPRLPARMREGSDEEDSNEDSDDLDDSQDPSQDHSTAWRRMRASEYANPSQHDLDLHSSSMLGMHPQSQSQPGRLHELIDPGPNGTDYTDYTKIEDILSEMQRQQKARAKTAHIPESSSSFSLDTPTDGGGVSARTRGKSRANPRGQASPTKQPQDETKPRIGGVGATIKPADKDQLLGLIMTSLSRRVQEADENAWMFGDERAAANGVSVSGSYNYVKNGELAEDY